MRKILTITILLFLGLSLFPSQARALSVSPSKFILSADPGEVLEQKMTIRNTLGEAASYYADFEIFTTGSQGDPVFLGQKTGLASWLEAIPSEALLEAGEAATIQIKISVPEDAEPGGHYAAIFWGSAPPSRVGGGVGIVARVASLVLLDVSGDVIEAVNLTNFGVSKKLSNHLPVSFGYSLENKGTVHAQPAGEVVIKNFWGKTITTLKVNPRGYNVLPGTSRNLPTADWLPEGGVPKIEGQGFLSDLARERAGFALGYYRALLNLEYGRGEIKTLQASVGFWVFPWRLIVVSLLILAVIILIIVKGIQKYNQWVIVKAKQGLRQELRGKRKK